MTDLCLVVINYPITSPLSSSLIFNGFSLVTVYYKFKNYHASSFFLVFLLYFVFLGAQAFSRKHPLSCWLSYMLVVFAGGMVANGLLAEPILAPLKNTAQVLVATAVW